MIYLCIFFFWFAILVWLFTVCVAGCATPLVTAQHYTLQPLPQAGWPLQLHIHHTFAHGKHTRTRWLHFFGSHTLFTIYLGLPCPTWLVRLHTVFYTSFTFITTHAVAIYLPISAHGSLARLRARSHAAAYLSSAPLPPSFSPLSSCLRVRTCKTLHSLALHVTHACYYVGPQRGAPSRLFTRILRTAPLPLSVHTPRVYVQFTQDRCTLPLYCHLVPSFRFYLHHWLVHGFLVLPHVYASSACSAPDPPSRAARCTRAYARLHIHICGLHTHTRCRLRARTPLQFTRTLR